MLLKHHGDSRHSPLHFPSQTPTGCFETKTSIHAARMTRPRFPEEPNQKSSSPREAKDFFAAETVLRQLGKPEFVPLRPGELARLAAMSRACFPRGLDQNIHLFPTCEFVLEQTAEQPNPEK